jgi:riboflavin kinase/FMN adenylyltransferase
MWRTIADVSELAKDEPALYALSGFDGVHRAHQQLVRRARELADAAGARLVLATWWPPLAEDPAAPRLLTTRAERADLLRALAGDATLLDLDLPAASAGILPGEIAERLMRHPRITAIVTPAELAAHLVVLPGVRVIIHEEGEEPVTAARVRHRLERGDVASAARLLGRSYALSGVVVQGDRRGRELGFPTANLRVDPLKLIPADGIYVVRTRVEGEAGMEDVEYGGAASIGVRPTFGAGKPRLVEVHVLDAQPDLYGRTLVVEFVAWIRAEERFDGVEALIARMRADVAQARAVLEGAAVSH